MKKIKVKPIDNQVGQYSKGGQQHTVPVWQTIRRNVESKPESVKPTWTFTLTINWGDLLLWFIVIFITIMLLR